jgi:hypothetical protein
MFLLFTCYPALTARIAFFGQQDNQIALVQALSACGGGFRGNGIE